jgi:hypothetical protein
MEWLDQRLTSVHSIYSIITESIVRYAKENRVYKKKRNLGISQEIDIVLKTKDFRRLGI